MLMLFGTNITSDVLRYLPNIKVWFLDYNINDNYEYLKNIKNLKVLDLLSGAKIVDNNIKNINIEHILLSYDSKITINGLNKNIKKLGLGNNTIIKDNDLKKLNLIYLDLSHNNTINNNGLEFCKNLKILNLRCNNKITDQGLDKLKNLENLNLSIDNHYINNNITNNLLKNLTKLKFKSRKKCKYN